MKSATEEKLLASLRQEWKERLEKGEMPAQILAGIKGKTERKLATILFVEWLREKPEFADDQFFIDQEGKYLLMSLKGEKFNQGKKEELKKLGFEEIRLGEKPKRSLLLVPQENNLIDLALWFPSTKGIKGKKLKLDKLEYKKGQLTFQFDRVLSLPTMFTFRVASICQDIWKVQGCADSFFTSRKQIARRLKIHPAGRNLEKVDTALRQLHNTYINAPFWLVDEKGNRKKQFLYRVNILNIFAEAEKDGQRIIHLQLNPYLVRNLKKQKHTLLDLNFMRALQSPVAERLYSKIKRQKGKTWSCSLGKIVELCNLRGRRKKEMIEKATQELADSSFLKDYSIKYSERIRDYVFTFIKK